MSGLMKSNDGLPEGWGWTTLNKACLIIQGQSPESSTYNDKGKGVPFFQGKAEFGELYPSPVKWCTSPKKKALKGDILISVRAPVGPTNIAPFECCVGRGLAALRSRDGIDSKYILYNLRSQINEIVNMGTGSTFTAINGAQLKGIEIPLAPLDQQNLIVSEIEKQFSRLDEAVAALKRVRAGLKRYKASVLKAAVEGKLTEEWRKQNQDVEPADKLLKRILTERRKKWEEANPKKKYKEPSAPDTSNLPELPEGWVWATVDQLYDIIGGGTPSTKISGYWDGKIPWITSADIYGVKDIRSRKQITQEAIKNSATNLVPKGSLIVVTRVGLGKIAITNTPLCFSQDSQALVGNNSSLFSVYSLYYLSNVVQRFKYEHRGTTIAGVTKKQLADLEFAIPPLPEQKQIVSEIESRLSVAEEIEETIDINLKRAERLRQSILKKAFLGRLVPQEHNKETAGKLN